MGVSLLWLVERAERGPRWQKKSREMRRKVLQASCETGRATRKNKPQARTA